MATTFKFNPERVAYFEAAGWRAYYDHKWIKMLRSSTYRLVEFKEGFSRNLEKSSTSSASNCVPACS